MTHEVVTDDDLIKVYGKHNNDDEKTTNIQQKVMSFLKKGTTCSRSKCKQLISSLLPITAWLPMYRFREDFSGDLVGGITVGIVHIPQGLAYSLLAGLPPIHGLYVSFFPVLIYAFFGTTRQLSIGTFAVISLMVAGALDKNIDITCELPAKNSKEQIVPESNHAMTTEIPSIQTGSYFQTTSSESCEQEVVLRKVQLAIGLCIAVAFIHFIMYILRLGMVTIYFSSQMVSGITCGAAFHVLTSQIAKLLGLDIPRRSGIFSVVQTYVDVFSNIHLSNWTTTLLSFSCIVLLVAGKEINKRFKAKLPFPIPWELILVILSTVASSYANVEANQQVQVVGKIPHGIATSVPHASHINAVLADAIPIAIVIYSISISLSKLLSEKHGYEVDANQELLAYAVANTVGAFFQCFPCGSSLSRSIIMDEIGGNSQLTGLISAGVVLVVLLWIGPLFEALPQATLAAIIIVNLKRLLLQFKQMKHLWKISKLDAITWFISWLAVILLGVDLGLYIGVLFSLFSVVLRTQTISGNSMVSVGDTGLYRNSMQFEGKFIKHCLIFTFPGPLIYANQERFKNQLYSFLGCKPALEITRRQKHLENQIKEYNQTTTFSSVITDQKHLQNNNKNQPEQKLKNKLNSSMQFGTNIRDSRVKSYKNLPIRVVLEMSSCCFIDNDGVKTLLSLLKELAKLNVRMVLAACNTEVRQRLLATGFPSYSHDGKPLFFISVQTAVSYEDEEYSDIASGESSDENLTEKSKRRNQESQSTWL